MPPGWQKKADEHRFSCVELWEGVSCVSACDGKGKGSLAWNKMECQATFVCGAEAAE